MIIREELELKMKKLLQVYQKQEIAWKLGISRPTLDRYLKDVFKMDIEIYNKVCVLYGRC